MRTMEIRTMISPRLLNMQTIMITTMMNTENRQQQHPPHLQQQQRHQLEQLQKQ